MTGAGSRHWSEHPHWRRFFECHTEDAKRAIVHNYRGGLIAKHIAIAQLRAAGCCEPEIAEVIA